jgi:hypothetical protein
MINIQKLTLKWVIAKQKHQHQQAHNAMAVNVKKLLYRFCMGVNHQGKILLEYRGNVMELLI